MPGKFKASLDHSRDSRRFRTPTVKWIAMWYSRIAVLAETFFAFVFLFPHRIAYWLFALGILGMWTISPLSIIDAIGPTLGVSLAGIYLTRQTSQAPAPATSPQP